MNEGKNLVKEFLTLKWAYWAHIIKKAIKKEGIKAKLGNQILMIKTVDIEILAAPTRLLIIIDNPKCLNSSTMLSNLTTQTIKIEIAIIILKSVIIFSILQFSYFFQNPEPPE